MPSKHRTRFLHVCTACGKERFTRQKENPSTLCHDCAFAATCKSRLDTLRQRWYANTGGVIYPDEITQRFWAYVQKTTTCWLWIGAKTKQGYGVLRIDGKNILVHRLSFELHVGPIPKGMYVLHRCDVRACILPEDLFLGTHLDNIHDMVQKNRHMTAKRLASPLRGSQHPNAKLTEQSVSEIYQRFQAAQGQLGIRTQLARELHVSISTISNVLKGEAWRHVRA
jgi:HNH endonuclease